MHDLYGAQGHCGTREESEGTPAQSSPTTHSRYMLRLPVYVDKFFPLLTLPASKLAMVALTELSGRKTSPCKEAIFAETGSSLAWSGSLEGGVWRLLGARNSSGPAMHRWREPLQCTLLMPLVWLTIWIYTVLLLYTIGIILCQVKLSICSIMSKLPI